jgi:hypothetical protein
MKKISTLIFAFIPIVMVLTACQLKEPKIEQSSDNPNLYVCNLPVMKPNQIDLYRNGTTKCITEENKQYHEVWDSVHQLVNHPKNDKNAIDALYTNDTIQTLKQNSLCFEFWYDLMLITEICNHPFEGMLFIIENTSLIFGYYTTQEKMDNEKSYTNFWKISNQNKKIETLKDLMII